MKRTIVVNLIAPPNSAKRQTGEKLCEELLKQGVTCSLVSQSGKGHETARYSSVKDEIYIFSKQFHKMFRLHGNIEVVVTDRPLVLSLYYNYKYGKGYYNRLNDLILEQDKNFYNMNFYLDNRFPTHDYDIDIEELMDMDGELKNLLKEFNISYMVVSDSQKRVKEMSELIIAEVEEYRASEEYIRVQEIDMRREKKEKEAKENENGKTE